MRQSIECKILPATNMKPTRIKASCQAGSKTESYDYDDMTGQQCDLITKLADDLNWLEHSDLVFGVLRNGSIVGVLVDK